ncbi:MAG: hypothetical protein HPKKFMNG_00762 [Planctomycetes bacterium]|nr:hypothetical protein [Planctomycetota bacterium]MCQ3948838.1 hypothetical protein [Planctomycetota bacterium]GIK51557.1 MAG: hypothetical protein BroJett014_05300 [Planctomycetota bacterium]HRJ77339.1 hypothetical protein [Planctomycetota bacterium]
MASIIVITNAQPQHLRDAALHVAQSTSYTITPLAEWSFGATQGSLALSILFGAFVAYCDFKLHVSSPGDGTTYLTLERNTPWWTGFIGVNRVKRRADDLVNAICSVLGSQGVAIFHRRDA